MGMQDWKDRPQELSGSLIGLTTGFFLGRLDKAIEKHGRGLCASNHEAVGLIEEELMELKQAIHDNDQKQIMLELADVAIAAFYGIASNLHRPARSQSKHKEK